MTDRDKLLRYVDGNLSAEHVRAKLKSGSQKMQSFARNTICFAMCRDA